MKNDDQWQKRENEIYKAERERLQKIEQERAFLKDKSIGGQNVPRPTEDFIDRSLGQPLSNREIAEQAGQKAETQIAQERAAEERREREAVRKMQQEDKPKRKLSEQGPKKEQAQKRDGQEPRKLSEQSQNRKIEFKRGKTR